MYLGILLSKCNVQSVFALARKEFLIYGTNPKFFVSQARLIVGRQGTAFNLSIFFRKKQRRTDGATTTTL